MQTRQPMDVPVHYWSAERHRRYLQRTWRHNPTPLSCSKLTRQTNFCNRLMSKAKSNYYTSTISKNSADQCSLWKVFNTILHCHPVRLLAECPSLKQLADKFGCYFTDKIYLIRSSFPSSAFQNSVDTATATSTLHNLSQFSPVSESEVETLIMRAPVKSCGLDPIPTHLLKSCIYSLLPPITQFINLSLSSGTFPPAFKFAHVTTPCLRSPVSARKILRTIVPYQTSVYFQTYWKGCSFSDRLLPWSYQQV